MQRIRNTVTLRLLNNATRQKGALLTKLLYLYVIPFKVIPIAPPGALQASRNLMKSFCKSSSRNCRFLMNVLN
jgi:hypothetical protein